MAWSPNDGMLVPRFNGYISMLPVPTELTVILEFKTLDSIQGPSVGIGSLISIN
jgi:hypothetical protein